MEVNYISLKQMKKQALFLTLTITFALLISGAVSADQVVGGQPITTVQSGTVSGGVYNDSYYGFTGAGATGNNNGKTANITYNFASLPSNAQVTNATLYVVVYCGHMEDPKNVNANVTFNGNTLDTITGMSSTYYFLGTYGNYGGGGNDNSGFTGHSSGEPYLMINDHIVRVTSDYLMKYDVTSLIGQNNVINVSTVGSFDGRIKYIGLIAPYNDGDSDKIYYWINQGQDVGSYLNEDNFNEAYVGSTTFNTSSITGTVESAALKDIYLASGNGNYGFPTATNDFTYTGGTPPVEGTFTNTSLDQTTPDVQASYSGSDSWDVTSSVNGTSDVTLGYARNFAGTGTAGYWKNAIAILTVKVQNSTPPVADFSGTPTTGTAPLTVNFTNASTDATTYAWDFDNNGTTDSTDTNPTWTYNTAGTYTVKLTATGPGGSDEEIKTNYITVNPAVVAPVAAFTATPLSGVRPLNVSFTDQSTNSPTSWNWEYKTGAGSWASFATTQNPTYSFTTAGTYDIRLTATNSGGSDDETKTGYITVLPQCDLTISGTVNPVPASNVFAGEANQVTVTNVKNNGPDAVTNIVVSLYASDVSSTVPVDSKTITSLASGATTTVSFTDPTIRPITANTVYGASGVTNIKYTAIVDPNNLIPETNEGNNSKQSVNKPIYYNGYKGQGLYEYNGTDINTKHVYDLRGDIIYYTQPDSAYKGVGWANRTETWTTSNLTVPSTGTVQDVWLYLPYNWDHTADGDPNWTINFNGTDITNSQLALYLDQSNFGAYAAYKYGLLVFNVTSLYNRNGDNNLIMTALPDNLVALYPSTLAVIYSDPNATRKQIFINEQCDELGLSASSYGTTLEEATAYAPFTGMTIDTGNVKTATIHSFVGSAGPDEGNLLFNGNTIALASTPGSAWQGNSNTASALIKDVKTYLTNTGNTAAIQGTTSGGMDTLQQFLVIEYNDTTPVAAFSGTPTTGTTPLTVAFTDASTGTVTSYAWDFDNNGTTDSTDTNPTWTYSTPGSYTVKETVTGPGGSDTETKTNYITVNVAPLPDLVVTAISPNVGAGAAMFANEPNVISVTVANQGTAAAPASTLNVVVNGNTYTANVPAINAGSNTTVTVTDTASHTNGESLPVNTNSDPSNSIPESNESNNTYSANLTVYNNGYKSKRYTGGSDLETQQTFDGNYDIVYSNGSSAYASYGWSNYTATWTAAQLPIPTGATVTQARLYQAYTWDQTPGGQPLLNVNFNGNSVNYSAWYSDTKGYATYNYPSGLYVYDVTSLFNTAGNTLTITPGTGNSESLYGSYLVVVYQDPNTSPKKIWINDGCDMLYSGTARSVDNTEGTSYAKFNGVSTTNLNNAKSIDILASANEAGKSKFFFNSTEYTGFSGNYLSGPQIGFSQYDITSTLQNGANNAGLQSFIVSGSGDNMVALNSILVAAYNKAPVAQFTGTPTTGTAPLTVTFTNTSTDAITYQWDFDNNGTTDSTDTNPVWTYNTAGTYTVKLTATGPGGSDDEIKTNYITVSGTPDLVSSNMQVPSSPIIATTYSVSATVTNSGTANASAFVVKLYDNNIQVARTTLTGLASGASTPVSFSWTPSTAGAHVLAVIADTNNEIIESSEINNLVSVQVSVNSSTQPDLTVSNLQVPSTPAAGTTYPVTVSVTNNGTVDAAAFAVKLYDNNVQVAKINLTGLAAGASTDVTFNWLTYTTGTHNLSVIADAKQQITEYNENNNQISQQVTVGASTQPDLTVTNLQLPANPVTGNTYQITVTVTNLGTVDAAAFAVKLYDNNTQVMKVNLAGLAAGASTQVTFNWTPTAGTHNLLVKADANNQITEYNENNNTITQQATVT